MPLSRPVHGGGYPDGCQDDLWDPGQEWIQIFDNLLKHPQGVKRGCSCDICLLAKYPAMHSSPLSPRLSLPTNLYNTGQRKPGVFETAIRLENSKPESDSPRCRGGSVDRMLVDKLERKQSGTVDEESFICQFQVPMRILVLTRKDLDLQLASVYTSLSSREWRKRIEGLQLVRGLVTGGAGNMEEFPGRLKYLELPFEICVKDLRSQVIRESCVTIAYLAQELQFKIKSFLLHLLPFLIELIQHGAKVVSYSGVVCIRFILQHTFCPK